MEELTKDELLDAIGGGVLTATLLSTLIKGATLSFELGQTLGSTIRRLLSSNFCEI